ncbi:MAG: amino acid adenylation domain-containing protein [Bacillota bacterium]
MNKHKSLVDALVYSSKLNSGITFITSEKEENFLSYKELYDKALSILHDLQARGIEKGQELVFQIESSEDFILVFWACLLGGIIPVPLTVGTNDEHKLKLFRIWEMMDNPYLITSTKVVSYLETYSQKTSLEIMQKIKGNTLFVEDLKSSGQKGTIHEAALDDIAFIQFSSGSTGEPKGVILTHENLLSNINAIIECAKLLPTDSSLSWMPLTHDMGIIGCHLTPLVFGINQYNMPTSLFIRHPILWFKKINEHRITLSSSPNFGYRYFLSFLKPDVAKEWDLSSIRLIFNGAEPISTELCKEFLDVMSEYKLKKTCMFTVYGLAEASLAVTFPPVNEEITVVTLERNSLVIGESVREALENKDAITFVDEGFPVTDCCVRICDEENRLLDENNVGYIQIKGKNVTKGYYKNQKATEELITKDGWLNTGDLGFLRKGRLVVTGRAKDIIFVNGQNYYPHDIERIAEELEGIELGKVAACGVYNPKEQKEEVLLFVYFKKKLEEFVLLAAKLKAHINNKVGLDIKSVIPVKQIPKTTSGKIKRYSLGEMYKNGEFNSLLNEMEMLLRASNTRELLMPRNDIEKELLNIWREVLGIEEIGVEDSFFESGGHSLKAAVLQSKISKEFNVDISITDLFENPTISRLSGYIKNSEKSVYTPIPQVDIRDYYKVSSAQKRMFLLNSIEGNNTNYNIPIVMTIEGEVEKELFEELYKKLIIRHEALRTSFMLVDGEPVQYIHHDVDFKINYSESDASNIDDIARNFVKPFNLEKAPLLRVEMVKLPDSRHLLLMDMHHIISDGTTIGILLNEISELCSGNKLPELRVQYKDFAEWQNNTLKSGLLKRQEEYWINRFSGEIPVLNMPTDYIRPAVQSFEGDTEEFTLSNELTSMISNLEKTTGSTLYMILLAAFNTLLFRYTGQEDIVIGSPIAGRNHEDARNLVGMFVNSLPMRNYPQKDKTFTGFLEEVKTNALMAFDNQDYQFEELVDKLQIRRDLSRNPIFDVMFTVQNMNIPDVYINNSKVSGYEVKNDKSKFDITLYTTKKEDNLSFSLEYSTNLFKRETITKLIRHFINILEIVVKKPEIKLSDIDLMAEEEKHELLYEFNNSRTDFPKEKTLQELFEEQVKKVPENIAVKLGDRKITYRELNDKSNQIARHLRNKGVKPDILVGMIMERSIEMIIGILAVLKAGGAYLPIDPDYPDARIDNIIKDSGISLLVTKSAMAKRYSKILEETSVEAILIDETDNILTNEDVGNLENINKSSDLAYVMYTSGSTGTPKGNLISHYNVSRVVKNTNYINITSEDILLQLSNYSFDGSTFDIFGALLNGAMLVMVDKETMLDMGKLADLIRNQNITIFFITTALFNTLVDLNIECFEKVKKVLFGGERVSVNHVRKALDYMGTGKLIHVYGPTESTVFATYYFINEIDERASTIPIGRPISNTQIFIVDKSNKLQPVGVAGELCISGDGLARGYLNRSEMTAEKFVPNPFVEGQTMYRTGDLVRWLTDGNIEFLDRIDTQVKIRGFRVELGEIEAQILKNRLVREAVVITKTSSNGNMYLYAYIVADEQLQVADLKESLSKDLPAYMVPSVFVKLDKLPLTPNGKVDKKSLPETDENIITQEEYVAATNDVQRNLVNIWESVLGIKCVGINDNFFDLGGNSLLLVRMHAQIDSLYKGKVSVTDLFTYTTISKLSEFIENRGSGLKKDINLKQILLPEDYFNDGSATSENSLFRFKFNETTTQMLRNLSEDCSVDISHTLLSLYVCLISKVAGKSEIAVHTILNGNGSACSLEISLEGAGDIPSILKLVHSKMDQKNEENTYIVDDILRSKIKKDESSVVPLFCRSNYLGVKENLLKLYDFILVVDQDQREISCTFEYNGRRLRKDKMKEFVNSYVKLTEYILYIFKNGELGVVK